MPRGRREASLVKLVNQLEALDVTRRRLVAQIQAAAAGLATGGMIVGGGWSAGGRPQGSKMTPEARAKISAAQKKRWAKFHAAKKG